MTTIADGGPIGSGKARIWLWLGVLLLVYAAAGNWLVLPGYRRFLAHESSGAGGLALVWGATRTILWMLSFHLGAWFLAIAVLARRDDVSRRFRIGFAIAGLVWIGLWCIPSLPGPYAAFFAGTGLLILAAVITVFMRSGAGTPGAGWRIAAMFFFALATWDACGLGSVGGILDPDGASRMANQPLVVAQTTKLIIELALAWGLLAVATLPARRS